MQRQSLPNRGPIENQILIIAGESSGDLHGAALVRELLRLRPDLKISGIGGDAMAAAGVEIILHASRLSLMGFVEVIGGLREVFAAFRLVKRFLDQERPDLVVLIDFPDFNLRVARRARRRGIPVVYYISPQIWAWRQGRIRRIARDVAHMIVIFPFEEALYRKRGVPVTYVGHPLMDRFGTLDLEAERRRGFRELGLSPLYPVVGLFPGSRASEVGRVLPVLLETAALLRERFPRLQFLLGESPGLDRAIYDPHLTDCAFPVFRVRTGIGPSMAACDLALVASGTATLELGALGVPMIVVYRVSMLTFALGALLVRVPAVGMVNLVPERGVVPELIQGEFNAKLLLEHCLRYLTAATYYFAVKRELGRIREKLGKPGASERAARVMIDLLHGAAERPDAAQTNPGPRDLAEDRNLDG